MPQAALTQGVGSSRQLRVDAGELTLLASPQLADLSGGIVRAGRVRERS